MTSILFSCQKEVDFANTGGGNGGANDVFLQKLVSRSGADSSTLEFGYNSAKANNLKYHRCNQWDNFFNPGKSREKNSRHYSKAHLLEDDQYQQLGLDSVVTVMEYSSGRYISKVTTIDLGIVVFRDSVALIYDAGGKVATERIYK